MGTWNVTSASCLPFLLDFLFKSCVCACVCLHVCVYVSTCVCVFVSMYVSAYCLCLYVCVCVSVSMYVFLCVCVHTCKEWCRRRWCSNGPVLHWEALGSWFQSCGKAWVMAEVTMLGYAPWALDPFFPFSQWLSPRLRARSALWSQWAVKGFLTSVSSKWDWYKSALGQHFHTPLRAFTSFMSF